MNFKFQPWDQDEWLSSQGSILKYDKLEHLLLSVIGVLIAVFLLKIEILLALSLMLLLGIAWEIRDGLITNGQGFSIKDLIADFIGVLIGYFFIVLF
jgi:VanZ family protein